MKNLKELKNLRTSLGLTQQELAKLLGVSLSTIGRWEGGKAHLNTWNLKTIGFLMALAEDARQGRNISQEDLSAHLKGLAHGKTAAKGASILPPSILKVVSQCGPHGLPAGVTAPILLKGR